MKRYHLPRPAIVTPETYELFDTLYGNCTSEDRLVHQLLLFSGQVDKDTGMVIIPSGLLRRIYGKCGRKSYPRARDYIAGFAERNGVVAYTHSVFHDGRHSTTRVQCFYPEELEKLATSEVLRALADRLFHAHTGLVDFQSGEPVGDWHVRMMRDAFRAEVNELIADRPDHPAYETLVWLATQSNKAQTRVVRSNANAAVAAVLSMPRGDYERRRCRDGLWRDLPDRDRCRFNANCRALATVLQDPNLGYRPASRSPRLYGHGLGLHSLSREIRKIALGGCWELDLRSAQLAIFAALCGCTDIQSFLETGGNWWQELMTVTGPVDKSLLKPGTFGTVFGASLQYVRRLLLHPEDGGCGLNKKRADALLAHPLMVELFEARDRTLARIIEQGGMTDAYGCRITLEQFASERRTTDAQARTVLAYVVQSYELRVILAALSVVRETPRASLTCFLHDGLSVSLPSREREARAIVAEICSAVNDELANVAARTGLRILTELEVDELPVVTTSRADVAALIAAQKCTLPQLMMAGVPGSA